MSSRRVTVYNNLSPEDAKILTLAPHTSLADFLKLAAGKLGSFAPNAPARKAFLQDGGELDDAELIRDNDVVYISAGEPFYRASGNGTNGAAGGKLGDASAAALPSVTYSIAVMGAGSVGKSALTLRYVQGVFVKDYDPTIEDAYRKNTTLDERPCTLDILDTAGQEDYTALRSTWMRERDGFLLVYSVVDHGTFEALSSFYEQLSAMHEEHMPPLVLVGNKADMSSKRQVSAAEGKRLAESWGHCAFLETSAKTGEGIEAAFAALVRDIRANAAPKQEEKPQKRKWACAIL